MTSLIVLDAIARHPGAVKPTQLRLELGLPRGALHAHLNTLELSGWIDRRPDGQYLLSLKAWEVGSQALAQSGVGERAHPVLEKLCSEIDETVALAVLDRETATIVRRVEPMREVLATAHYADRLALKHTASGRVLLAFSAKETIDALVLRGVEVPSQAELAKTRSRGYGLVDPKVAGEISAIAVPVYGADGTVFAALSAIGPSHRFNANSALGALQAAADEILRR